MSRFKQMALGLSVLAGIGFSSTASAALFDRGNGLIYDDVLNVTWLQDANYAKTSGYSLTGLMDWYDADKWARNLNYNGITGWSLPNATEGGYNITNTDNLLSYMYYVNLGLLGQNNILGEPQPNYGIFGDGTRGGEKDVGLIKNLQSGIYWTSGQAPNYTSQFYYNFYYVFHMDSGYQNAWGTQNGFSGNLFYAWAVHPGDVSSVPVPAAIWLFASGLGLFSFITRRKH
jgi:hypothetical protein